MSWNDLPLKSQSDQERSVPVLYLIVLRQPAARNCQEYPDSNATIGGGLRDGHIPRWGERAALACACAASAMIAFAVRDRGGVASGESKWKVSW